MSQRLSSKSGLRVVAMAVAGLSAAPYAHAIVTAGGTGEETRNTTPAGITGYDNVGKLQDASAVYLGDGWVITAAHVGASSAPWSVSLNGNSYAEDTTVARQIVINPAVYNTDGSVKTPASQTDLVLGRLTVDPATVDPTIKRTVIGATPQTGSPVTIVGWGMGRESTPTTWYYSEANKDLSWETTPDPTRPNTQVGYRWAGDRVKRWGTSTTGALQDDGSPTYLQEFPGGPSTWLFGSEFGGTTKSTDATVAAGDSGGGVFDAHNRLVGINLYVAPYKNQPGGTAVFGNYTLFADLATYADEIARETKWAPSILGDANLDGVVNRADFLILHANFDTGTAWTQGDFNLDGIVNFDDYQILEAHFGTAFDGLLAGDSIPSGADLSGLGTVPEPGTLALAGAAAVGALWRRRRRTPNRVRHDRS